MDLRMRGVATPTTDADLQDLYSMTKKDLHIEALVDARSTYNMKKKGAS